MTQRNATEDVETLSPAAALELVDREDVAFVDVREGEELRKTGKIKGSVHAPLGSLHKGLPKRVSRASRLVLYCASGRRSAIAAQTLRSMGVKNVAHVPGGLAALQKAGGETEDVA